MEKTCTELTQMFQILELPLGSSAKKNKKNKQTKKNSSLTFAHVNKHEIFIYSGKGSIDRLISKEIYCCKQHDDPTLRRLGLTPGHGCFGRDITYLNQIIRLEIRYMYFQLNSKLINKHLHRRQLFTTFCRNTGFYLTG